jgi:hypothetical protein
MASEIVVVWLCAGVLESETVNVTLLVPLLVGVPEINPLLPKLSPAGKAPPLTDQL